MPIQNKQVFLWYGDNDYAIHQKVNQWISVFEKKHGRLNLFNFDFNEPGSKDALMSELKNALQINSLFGANKLILLKNFLSLKSKLSDDWKEFLIKAMKTVSPGFFLIFYQTDKPDATNAVVKALKAQSKKDEAGVEEFVLPRFNDINKWIIGKANERGVVLPPNVVSLLAGLVGGDLWQLDNEISKLANYAAGRAITADDVKLLVKGKYNDDIFQLTDAIAKKDKKKVIQLFQDQLNSGANEFYLLTMLVREFRILWQVKDLTNDRRMSSSEVAAALGMSSYPAQKSLEHCGHFSLEEIKKIYKGLLNLEFKVKTSGAKFETLFDLLISRI